MSTVESTENTHRWYLIMLWRAVVSDWKDIYKSTFKRYPNLRIGAPFIGDPYEDERMPLDPKSYFKEMFAIDDEIEANNLRKTLWTAAWVSVDD